MSQEVSPPQRHRDSIFRESQAEIFLLGAEFYLVLLYSDWQKY